MSTQLKVIDYAVFFLTLIAYSIIGIYFGCFGRKQKSAKEYMYGMRSLKAIPIGLSIYSSSVSAISMLGTPQEIYVFGTQYSVHIIGSYLSLIITWKFVVPVFNGTQNFKSPYEYYEYRFNKIVRYVSSLIYIINGMSAVPIVLYTCCLPISQATGVNIVVCSTILGGICVIYTMLGGFTTVIWTDVVQAILMFVTLFCLVIASVIRVGGFKTIWTNADIGERIKFNDFDLNPFKRLSFWCVTLGSMFNYAAHQGCAASTLQRYLSVKTEKDAKTSVFIGVTGFVFNSIIGTTVGLCMYTMYKGCDPVASNELKNYNQLTPHFALDTLSYIPGLSGVLIAGLLSAGLSSMSAELNTISGIMYYDLIQKNFKKYYSDNKGAFIMKLLVLLFGVYFILMVMIVQKIKYIVPITITLAGTANGLKLGLLILGTAFPKSNSKGALCGMIIGGIIMSWIAINATINNVGSLESLPVSIDNCTHLNDTLTNNVDYLNYTTVIPLIDDLSNVPKTEPFFIYKLSFLYYAMFGTFITIVVALAVSYATGGNDFEKMNPNLFIPCVRPKKRIKQEEEEFCIMLQKDINN